MVTPKQKTANRKNARKGGPKTPKGKALVSQNARKHGIFASTLTEFDDEEVCRIHDELTAWIRPVGPVEEMLVEQVACTYLRLQRSARAEAEFHTETWQRKTGYTFDRYAQKKGQGLHASWFDSNRFERSVALFMRYNTALTNQFMKLLHEIERMQRLRSGEKVPPPLAADVTVRVEEGNNEQLPALDVTDLVEMAGGGLADADAGADGAVAAAAVVGLSEGTDGSDG